MTKRRYRPILSGLDLARFPLANGTPTTLAVLTLTVVVGASLLPPPRDGGEIPTGLTVTVTVDGALILDGADLDEVVGMDPFRSEDEDVLVLTPREEGVEVTVELGGRGAYRKTRGFELWLHLAR